MVKTRWPVSSSSAVFISVGSPGFNQKSVMVMIPLSLTGLRLWMVAPQICERWTTTLLCLVSDSHSYPPLIHDLEVSPLQEAAHFGLPSQDGLHQLSGDLLFLLIRQRHVPLLKPELALSAEQEHKLHLQWGHERGKELWNSAGGERKVWVVKDIGRKETFHDTFTCENGRRCQDFLYDSVTQIEGKMS